MGFANKIIGGAAALVRAAIKSPNYVPGSTGWSINKDGSAEFSNLTIRGTFNGTNYVMNSAGLFFYSPSEAAGNLINSVTNASGTDSFGNIYLRGSASYGTSQATTSVEGVLFFYTGSLAGGWVQQGSIQADTTNAGQIDTQGNAQISGNLTVQGTATINGSGSTAAPSNNNTSTNGLTDGTIHGTSGAASAGTAHTHGPGSFAVGNGQHAHNLSSHTHVL